MQEFFNLSVSKPVRMADCCLTGLGMRSQDARPKLITEIIDHYYYYYYYYY